MTPPPAVRAITAGVTDAISAVAATDPAAFDAAAARLAALDREQVGVVLGAVVRSLLEETHPDGLTADDLRAVLGDVTRSAAPWRPDLDPAVLVTVLTGALGVHDPDAEPLDGVAVTGHAVLVTAHLLATADRPVSDALGAAYTEIARAETHD